MANKKRLLFILAIPFALVLATVAVRCACGLIYPVRYRETVVACSEPYGLDPLLVLAVIKVESGFRADAVSPRNAVGLMQITGKTGKWGAENLGLEDYTCEKLFDPETNIRIGCWYLSLLHREFGSIDLALAAYNAGSGNVSKWLSDPRYSRTGKVLDFIPFKETEQYVKKVRKCYRIYKRLYENEF